MYELHIKCLLVLVWCGTLVGCAFESGPQKVWGQYETYSCEDLAAERDRLDALALSYKEGEAREEYLKEENSLLAVFGNALGLRKHTSLKDRIARVETQSGLMTKHMTDKDCPAVEERE